MSVRMGLAAALSVVILGSGIVALPQVKGQTALRKESIGQIILRIEPPRAECNCPVNAAIELPEQFVGVPVEQIDVVLKDQDGTSVPGQIVIDAGQAQLWWIMPCEKANLGSSWTATLERRKQARAGGFSWEDTPGEHLDLLFNGRKVMQYVYARDTSTPKRNFETNKPFHNVFDLAGKKLITNCDPEALYPHHRGLFLGWQRVTCGDEHYDFWGMNKLGTAQVHQKFLELSAGPVLARAKALIHWNDKDGNTIIAEERQVTAFAQAEPSILLMEFKTTLKAVKDTVFLHSNNPAKAVEHGGVQFRPHNDAAKASERSASYTDKVAEEDKVKYLFHYDGVDPKKDFDLPWVAMSYGLRGRHYTVQYINHPANPKPSYYSAYRAYGRFGAYFEKQIKPGQDLTACYWLWIVESKMPAREEMAGRYSSVINTRTAEALSRRQK